MMKSPLTYGFKRCWIRIISLMIMPMVLPVTSLSTALVDNRLYEGNEFQNFRGLGWTDNTARRLDNILGRFTAIDPLAEKYPDISPYASRANNPFKYVDFDGSRTTLHTTTLPGVLSCIPKDYNFPTHSFISVTNDKTGQLEGYYAFGSDKSGLAGSISGRLKRCVYDQDLNVISGKDDTHEKMSFVIPPPEGMTSEEFDKKVIEVAESFGNDTGIRYNMLPTTETEGNCNTSTSTILLKAGVPKQVIETIKKVIPGVSIGFDSYARPWTKDEQKQAVENKRKSEEIDNEINRIHP